MILPGTNAEDVADVREAEPNAEDAADDQAPGPNVTGAARRFRQRNRTRRTRLAIQCRDRTRWARLDDQAPGPNAEDEAGEPVPGTNTMGAA